MDDANIPSLLSLPYLGFVSKSDPLYKKTRAWILSTSNPYFFRGAAGEGVGGPHVGMLYNIYNIMYALLIVWIL